MQNLPSSQSVAIKIIITVLIMLTDLILNSFIQASFSSSSQTNKTVNFYFLAFQIVSTCLILVMVIILLWQTFPLRYGLINSIYKQFKWTFLVIFIFIGLTGAQRGLKIRLVDTSEQFNQVAMWDNIAYQILYFLRVFSYPVFYGFVLNFCIRIADPTFYRPNRWLK